MSKSRTLSTEHTFVVGKARTGALLFVAIGVVALLAQASVASVSAAAANKVLADFSASAAASNAATAYHVDCQNGNDANNGRSPGSAWRSLNKANQAPLQPGDSLLFKRGCKWTGTLKANWRGTSSQPILIGAYGSGNKPIIHNRPQDLNNRYHANVLISGSYQIIEHLTTYIHNPPVEAGCGNNPVGFYVGFAFRNANNQPDGGSHNVLRYVEALKHTAGAHISRDANNNRIEYSSFRGNHVMHVLTPKSQNSNDDIGAWGILLRGSNNEIAHNYFAHNNSWYAYDSPPQGNSVEIYEGRNNNVHHNTSYHDLVFSELGGSSQQRASGNRFAYNLMISPLKNARFVVVRGGGNAYGPTYDTTLYHNTVYLTGSQSQAVVCHSGCSNSILTAVANIFWAEEKAFFADGRFTERENIYWNRSGDPFVQFQGFNLDSSSMVANPHFLNPSARQFYLQANSPAIDAANTVRESTDMNGDSVPHNGRADIGAFEWPGANASISSNELVLQEDIDLAETLQEQTDDAIDTDTTDDGVPEDEAPNDEVPEESMPDNLPEEDDDAEQMQSILLPIVSN